MVFNLSKLLRNPPYLQLAIDIPNLMQVGKLLARIDNHHSPHLLLEMGTPLIKNEGIKNVIPIIRDRFPEIYLISDLKTLDVGKLEVEFSVKSGSDACVVSGLAPRATIKEFIQACNDFGVDAWIDTLGTDIDDFIEKIERIEVKPEVIIVHRGIDEELSGVKSSWENISRLEKKASLIAAAGGLTLENLEQALYHGAKILIIGRAIYQSETPQSMIEKFYKKMGLN